MGLKALDFVGLGQNREIRSPPSFCPSIGLGFTGQDADEFYFILSFPIWQDQLRSPSMPTLIQMAQIFDCTVDYLLGVSEVQHPQPVPALTPREVDIMVKYRRRTRENQIRMDERMDVLIERQRE